MDLFNGPWGALLQIPLSVSIYEETQEVLMKNCFLIAVVVCCLFSVQSFAQTSNATLGGTVSDPSGALIPGVGITATNAATGIVTTSVSNEAGAYNFPKGSRKNNLAFSSGRS
jgi:hypothetical protein